jgi:FAD/FMN-containing dehydrogenase
LVSLYEIFRANVARAVAYARVTGTHVVLRGGGHCFAGRSSTKD